MIKLDDNLLTEIGLAALPQEEKASFLKHMYETLELRVGTRLAERMSDQQMAEFEQFINNEDESGAFQWLESNFPDYKDVVSQEFDRLKGEIAPLAPQILAASSPSSQSDGSAPAPQAPAQQPAPQQEWQQPPVSPAADDQAYTPQDWQQAAHQQMSQAPQAQQAPSSAGPAPMTPPQPASAQQDWQQAPVNPPAPQPNQQPWQNQVAQPSFTSGRVEEPAPPSSPFDQPQQYPHSSAQHTPPRAPQPPQGQYGQPAYHDQPNYGQPPTQQGQQYGQNDQSQPSQYGQPQPGPYNQQ